MKKNADKSYLRDILILFVVALISGIYLTATTVVISRDGVFYIETAQKMQTHASSVLAERPSGYELMILSSHRILGAVTGGQSTQDWIWAAQGLTLFCRILTVIALYLAGCLTTGRNSSFWGCMILLLLPEPARMGSDVLREWPNLLFMSFIFLCLLAGFKRKCLWAFGLVGLLGSVSFSIRPESLQLVMITGILLAFFILKPSENFRRWRAVTGIVLLVIGFTGPLLVYAGYSGQLKTAYLQKYQTKAFTLLTNSSFNSSALPDGGERDNGADQSLSGFFYELFKNTGEMLMWFFVPFWGIGLYHHLRNKADPIERFSVMALIAIMSGLIFFRYWCIQPVVSSRWILPILGLTIFYIPIGIKQTVRWAAERNVLPAENPEKWSLMITAAGLLICLPKLMVPMGYDKKGYRDAASWIMENTRPNEIICSFDSRIPFYADRNYVLYKDNLNPAVKADYLIALSKESKTDIIVPGAAKLQRSFPLDSKEKDVLIFRCEP
jgi:hypothetical protein